MLMTSANKPATLRMTMRRVRLDEPCATRNRQRERMNPAARRSHPGARRGGTSPISAAAGDTLAVRSSTFCYVRWRARALKKISRRCSTAIRATVSAFLETVADAVKRLDHVEIVIGSLELLAQPLDVAVDGAVVDIDLIVIGRIHQRVPAL